MDLILELAFLLNLLLSGLFSKAKYFDVCDNFQDKCFDVSKLTAFFSSRGKFICLGAIRTILFSNSLLSGLFRQGDVLMFGSIFKINVGWLQ